MMSEWCTLMWNQLGHGVHFVSEQRQHSFCSDFILTRHVDKTVTTAKRWVSMLRCLLGSHLIYEEANAPLILYKGGGFAGDRVYFRRKLHTCRATHNAVRSCSQHVFTDDPSVGSQKNTSAIFCIWMQCFIATNSKIRESIDDLREKFSLPRFIIHFVTHSQRGYPVIIK